MIAEIGHRDRRVGAKRRLVVWVLGQSAVVTLTHASRLDDPALIAALRNEAFYVGALGSTRTQERRRKRPRAAGLDQSQLARLHGPVGLPIGALTPAESATSILAEVIKLRRKPLVAGDG